MQITKYEHACFVAQSDGRKLVVDPGNLTTDLDISDNIDVVVITHEHGDHFWVDNLAQLAEASPGLTIVGPESVIDQIKSDYTTIVATPGESLTIGSFSLDFYGGTHAEIHSDIPRISNVGVMINKSVFYPGDSLARPDQPVEILALPAAAPWLKIGEAIDLLRDIKPRAAFPTHDSIYSDSGKTIADNMLSAAAKSIGADYTRLESSESVTTK